MSGNPVVLVTGVNGGIGRAIASTLSSAGHVVVGTGRTPDCASGVPYVPCDLADVAAIERLVDEVTSRHGPIRVLVNNAGVRSGKTFFEATPEDFDLAFAVNARAPFFLCQAVARRIAAAGTGGAIVNVSSLVARTGSPSVEYGGSKAALSNITRALAKPLGALGIRINAVAPGFVNTAMTAGLAPERREQILRGCGLRRPAEPLEVAAVVAFLVSDASAYITGTVVEVDGGA